MKSCCDIAFFNTFFSTQTLKCYQQILAASKVLNIPILDPLNINNESHYSFADNGVL